METFLCQQYLSSQTNRKESDAVASWFHNLYERRNAGLIKVVQIKFE